MRSTLIYQINSCLTLPSNFRHCYLTFGRVMISAFFYIHIYKRNLSSLLNHNSEMSPLCTTGMKALRNITSFLVILLCCSVLSSSAEYLKYKDPNAPLKARITDLLSRMTLAEKIGQMSQIERLNATADVLQNYFIGTELLKFPFKV